MLGQRLSSLQAHFERTDDFGFVANRDSVGRHGIQTQQQPMQMFAALPLRPRFQPASPMQRSRGSGKETFGECPQIETRSTGKNRKPAPIPDVFEGFTGLSL